MENTTLKGTRDATVLVRAYSRRGRRRATALREELRFGFVPMMKAVDLTDRLHEIRRPTLVVVPGHDPLGAAAQYQVSEQRISDCKFIVYHDLPHNITDAVPEKCAAELRDFILR